MAPRALWKGSIKLAQLTCPVAMYAAASTSERITFHILNRKTGHLVHREYIDDETGRPVEASDQVKGYETGNGEYLVLEPEEIAAAIPESDKLLSIDSFIACNTVDDTYFDRPYFLAPASPAAEATFALLRDGMVDRQVAAIAHSVLFRRLRAVLIRPHRHGLIATTLNFDYEVRSADEAFKDIPATKLDPEMVDLAAHIISTKAATFDSKAFDDRYDSALAELVKAKLDGRTLKAPPQPTPTKPHDLLEALRLSARPGGASPPPRKSGATPQRKATANRRKAG